LARGAHVMALASDPSAADDMAAGPVRRDRGRLSPITSLFSCSPPLGLRWRLVLLVLLPSLPALALVLQDATAERDSLLAAAEARTLRLARAWSDHHSDLVREAKTMLIAGARTSVSSSGCGAELAELTARARWPSPLAVIDQRGAILCSSLAGGEALDGIDA